MFKGLISKYQREDRDRELLAIEVSEIEEIAERLYARIDEKIGQLKAAEAAADTKMAALEKLVLRAEGLDLSADYGVDSRYREIATLARKGLEADAIASILEVPRGEVDLILSIGG
jgi:hypothetical protein